MQKSTKTSWWQLVIGGYLTFTVGFLTLNKEFIFSASLFLLLLLFLILITFLNLKANNCIYFFLFIIPPLTILALYLHRLNAVDVMFFISLIFPFCLMITFVKLIDVSSNIIKMKNVSIISAAILFGMLYIIWLLNNVEFLKQALIKPIKEPGIINVFLEDFKNPSRSVNDDFNDQLYDQLKEKFKIPTAIILCDSIADNDTTYVVHVFLKNEYDHRKVRSALRSLDSLYDISFGGNYQEFPRSANPIWEVRDLHAKINNKSIADVFTKPQPFESNAGHYFRTNIQLKTDPDIVFKVRDAIYYICGVIENFEFIRLAMNEKGFRRRLLINKLDIRTMELAKKIGNVSVARFHSGNIYLLQANRNKNGIDLSSAIQNYRLALDSLTIEDSPIKPDEYKIKFNLATAYKMMLDFSDNFAYFDSARYFYKAAFTLRQSAEIADVFSGFLYENIRCISIIRNRILYNGGKYEELCQEFINIAELRIARFTPKDEKTTIEQIKSEIEDVKEYQKKYKN
jgi:hypothetical protein